MDEITEAIDAQTKTWTWIAMGSCERGGGHYGYGNTEAEALANANDHGCVDDMKVGRFSEPTKVVVDIFGRIHWKPSTSTLEWIE
jgi:hypothetical protein